MAETLQRLSRFNNNYKIKTGLLHYALLQSDIEYQNRHLSDTFKQLDTNGDGVISRQELLDGYRLLGMDGIDLEQHIDNIMNNIDTDRNGYIDYNEFMVSATDR